MKLRYLAGYCTSFLAFYNRIHFLLAKDAAKSCLRILMYHNIPEKKFPQFECQIHYLAAIYKFITPVQFHDFILGKYSISGTNLLITFDDGFKSNRIVAEKVLHPLGIKGIFFVPTEFIGLPDENKQGEFIVRQIFDGDIDNPEISSDMKPLTWEDIKYLKDHGHAIGSHTKSHSRLSNLLAKGDLYIEIVESGNMLEKKLGVPINYFAYPFGDINSINKNAMDLIKKRYTYCFSGVRGKNFYPFSNYAIKRDAISVDDPLSYVRFIIEGGLDVIYRKKARKLLELTEESAG